jgi:hypothetical protein
MDNKKIVTVAVLAVLALAFAGYGYADYTASTYNANNSIEVNYITVEPDDWTAIAAAEEIKIDTYTYNDDIIYVLAGDLQMPSKAGYVKIGNNYGLTITDGTNKDFSKYTIDVTVVGEINQAENQGDGFKLFLKYGEGDDDVVELAETMSFDVTTTDVTLGLYMYIDNIETIKFPATSGWEDITGSTDVPPVGPVLSGSDYADDPHTDATETGAIFIFKVTGVE